MIHYLILAHDKPWQIEILINLIASPFSRIYIHLDKKCPIADFSKLKNRACFIENRVYVNWGGFSMVQSTLNSMAEIQKYMADDDHLIILSWHDLPIKSPLYIYNVLKKSKNLNYIQTILQPNADRNIIPRIERYWFYDIQTNTYIDMLLKKFVSFFMRDIQWKTQVIVSVLNNIWKLLPKRKYVSKKYTVYAGSQWMVVSKRSLDYVLRFCDSDEWEKFISFAKRTCIPDEFFFHTILMNSDFANDTINECMWYMITPSRVPNSPEIIRKWHTKKILQSKKLFCRKFDMDIDIDALESVYNYVQQQTLRMQQEIA